VYDYDTLQPGLSISGPALLINAISTIVVEPGCTAHVTAAGDVRIDIASAVKGAGVDAEAVTCDPIQLAIFSHRCCLLESSWTLKPRQFCDVHTFQAPHALLMSGHALARSIYA
jgi:hypothetical protein